MGNAVPHPAGALAIVYQPNPQPHVPRIKEQERGGQASGRPIYSGNVLSIDQEERERKNRWTFATDFDFIDKTTADNADDPNYLPNKCPWRFLILLEAMMRTFA